MENKTLRKSIHHNLHASLRKALIKARKDLGLSQRDLAERLGITRSVIGKVETGDRRLDVVEFYEYTKALELVPSETLFLLFHEHQKHGGVEPNSSLKQLRCSSITAIFIKVLLFYRWPQPILFQ